MKAKITQVEIIPTLIKLNEPFVISKGALTHAKNTIIIIHCDQGLFGTGECCPYRSIHGETQEGTVAVGKAIGEAIIGLNPLHIAKLNTLMNRIIVGNASIKCAFDMALVDLGAKLAERPLYEYLGGSLDKKIYTDMTVSILEKEKMAEKATKYADQGFPFLKIKLGDRRKHADISRMAAIRTAIGNDIPIRIDANQGWNYQIALETLEGIRGMNIEHCEEPVPAWNTIDQARLNQSSPIPIMADEAVFNHHDAYQVLASDAATMINIKLGKAGGITNAMKIGAIAEAADVLCQVGSFSESRLGITALVHFSYAWSHIQFYDLDSPLMLSEDPVEGGLKYGDDWEVTIDDTPGHGATMDRSFLEKFEIITIT